MADMKLARRKRKRLETSPLVTQPKLLTEFDDMTWLFLCYFDIADLQAFVGTNKVMHNMLPEILQNVAAAILPQYKPTRVAFSNISFSIIKHSIYPSPHPKVHPFLNGFQFLTDYDIYPYFEIPQRMETTFFPVVESREIAPFTTWAELFSGWFTTRCIVCGHYVASGHPERFHLSTSNGTVCCHCSPRVRHAIPEAIERYSGNLTAALSKCPIVFMMTWLKGAVHSSTNIAKLLKWSTRDAYTNLFKPIPKNIQSMTKIHDRCVEKLKKLVDAIFPYGTVPNVRTYNQIFSRFMRLQLPLFTTKEEFLAEFNHVAHKCEEALIWNPNLPEQLVQQFAFHRNATMKHLKNVWSTHLAWHCDIADLTLLWSYSLRSVRPSKRSFVAFCVFLMPDRVQKSCVLGCMLRQDQGFDHPTHNVFTKWNKGARLEIEHLSILAPRICLVCRSAMATHNDDRFPNETAHRSFTMCESCYYLPVPVWNDATGTSDPVVPPLSMPFMNMSVGGGIFTLSESHMAMI
jgi:hypothetical protein